MWKAYKSSNYVDVLNGESLFSKKNKLVIRNPPKDEENSSSNIKIEPRGVTPKFSPTRYFFDELAKNY